jgi:hypothetical protein
MISSVKRLQDRIAALEHRMVGGEIICRMADGTERSIRSRRLVHMIGEITRGVVKDDTRAVLECVSDNCQAAENGHLPELLRVLWHARESSAQLTAEEAARLRAIG